MRSFYFTSRIIGEERYLTYTMGAETELDEDVLDYCEENQPGELLPIIYEEDEEYDYLTYDVSSRVSLEDFMQHEMTEAGVLTLLKNISEGLISVKEQAIHLSYILLNKSFVFVDENDLSVSFICLPVESKASLAVEFKSFVRQILAYMRYDVEEDLNYVGKLLTYINGDNFNLRGLIGLTEALMEEAGIEYEDEGTTSDDGIEIVNLGPVEDEHKDDMNDFMSGAGASDVPLPEIGDDEENSESAYDETQESEDNADALFASVTGVLKKENEAAKQAEAVAEDPSVKRDNAAAAPAPEEPEETPAEEAPASDDSEVLRAAVKSEMVAEIKQKMAETASEVKEPEKTEEEASADTSESEDDSSEENKTGLRGITGIGGGAPKIVHPLPIAGVTTGPSISMKKTIKVNRAAMIQSHAAEVGAEGENAEEKNIPAAAPSAAPAAADTPVAKPADVKAETPAEAPAPDATAELQTEESEAKPKVKAKQSALPKALPYLIRVSTKEIIMLNKPQFKLGKASRGVDFSISGNGAVSRQHAVIIQKDGEVFIKDNKSTNHTYVNGTQIDEGVEYPLTHDADIMLGDEEFKFKIR